MASISILEGVKEAMTAYYTLLSTMPHYTSDSLRCPPRDGWSSVDVASLKALGRSDAAIEFLRHLPGLEPCVNSSKAWITWSSPAIALHHGETWPLYIGKEVGVSTPPHLIYLSTAVDARYGTHLILDTERGTIVEVSMDGGPLESISWDEYDRLPEAEQWTAHRALPAKAFFAQATVRMQRLVYMPVPPPLGNIDYPAFYQRAKNMLEEKELLAVEDEWEAEHEDDSDYVNDEPGDAAVSLGEAKFEDLQLRPEEENSDDDDEYDDIPLDEDELEELRAENEEYLRRQMVKTPGSGLTSWKPIDLPRNTLSVYDIYKRHGWPYDGFNVDQCRAELIEFEAERRQKQALRSASNLAKPVLTKEAWCEERRQLMKQKWKSEGREWDNETEKAQTAQEWWAEFQQEMRKGSSKTGMDDG